MLDLKLQAKGLAGMQEFLLAMQGRANRPTAVALTRTAKLVQQAAKTAASRHIDRPTRWTLNSTYIRPAKPDRLSLEMGFKDYSNTGTPAAQYLQAIAAGGGRPLKPFEKRLQSKGLLGSGKFAVPTGFAPLKFNAYGNLPGSSYLQVLSRLKALREVGSLQNASGSKRSRAKQKNLAFFVADINGNRGIWAREGSKRNISLAFSFLNGSPKYDSTFPIARILRETFEANFDHQFEAAIQQEMDYHARKGR